jgi:hypothetical protein
MLGPVIEAQRSWKIRKNPGRQSGCWPLRHVLAREDPLRHMSVMEHREIIIGIFAAFVAAVFIIWGTR